MSALTRHPPNTTTNNDCRYEEHDEPRRSALMQPDIVTIIISLLELRDMASCCSVSQAFHAATAQVETVHIQLDHAHSVQKLHFATRMFRNLKNVHLEYRGDALVCPSDVRAFLRSCCSTIRQFYFTSRYTFSGAAFEPLRYACAPLLEKLRFKCCRFDSVDDLIVILEHQKHLRVLDLSLVKFGVDSTFLLRRDYQPIAPYIGALHNLRELILDGWDLQCFDTAKLFCKMSKLSKLIVCEASDESLMHVSQHCRNLRTLEINGYNCRREISVVPGLLSMLHRLPIIETLYIPHLKLHDDDVIHDLSEAGGGHLKVLVVSPDLFSRISTLSSSSNDLEDEEKENDLDAKLQQVEMKKKMESTLDGKKNTRSTSSSSLSSRGKVVTSSHRSKSNDADPSDTYTRFKGELGDSILHAW